ncbi:unnamed protein product [Aphanomyces euteiches]|uniref:HIG1 domain-containing protein n=1 Tax=Aphanomyces euteiches TaxID=100861 RepID=A0A6G0X4K4_9STRA|nr:hypothetical protein Ae201684_008582 [Aphanomyces euteiches]KAH9085568.1 hypothetical protein Ae201684P_005274 [Aphanomyces euteiches]KAH9153440.1 hypothetical protein AeRB84_004319 [Aphanomyces euteiches]
MQCSLGILGATNRTSHNSPILQFSNFKANQNMSAAAQLDKRDIIMSNSTSIGFKAGATAGVVAGAAVALANHNLPAFRNRLGVSGKVGLVVMASIASFTIAAEQDLLRGSRNPDEYINELQGAKTSNDARNTRHGQLPLHQRAANYVLDHPFRTVAFSAAPIVGGIYLYQQQNTNIQLSQKIMHTRIYGQGSSVVILLATMAFYDYMSRHGRFE